MFRLFSSYGWAAHAGLEGPGAPPDRLAAIQQLTARVATDIQDTKVDDQQSFADLQARLGDTIGGQDFTALSPGLRTELTQASDILTQIRDLGKATGEQVKRLKDLSQQLLLEGVKPDTEVKWGSLNDRIKDDDSRYQYLKQNPTMFLLPEGGMQDKGGVKDKFPNGEAVPALHDAICEDLAAVRGKFNSPEELQQGLQNGFGTRLSDDDAHALFSFIEAGSIRDDGKVTGEDVGRLQKILGSISPHFEARLAKNGLYDSRYGYATTEEVRLLAGQMAKKAPEPPPEVVIEIPQPRPKWVPSKDAAYLVDVSGSMSDTARNFFGLVDKYLGLQGDASSARHVKARFAEQENGIQVAGSGNLEVNTTGTEKAQTMAHALRQKQVDQSLGDAFSLVAGKPPTEQGIHQFAGLFGLKDREVRHLLDDAGQLDVAKFRDKIGDPFRGGQEAGLKTALLALMNNDAYQGPGKPGHKQELYIATDEPEHEFQYMELVKKLAELKGVTVKVVALPTTLAADGNEALNKSHQESIGRFTKMRDRALADHQAGKLNDEQLAQKLKYCDVHIKIEQHYIDQHSIHTINLTDLSKEYVKDHLVRDGDGYQQFKWIDAQDAVGRDSR